MPLVDPTREEIEALVLPPNRISPASLRASAKAKLRSAIEQDGEASFSRTDLEVAVRETDAEHRREPLTDVLAAFWGRLFPGEELPLTASPTEAPSS